MATINSNSLGVYSLDTTQTSPLEVLDTTETTITNITDSGVPDGVATGDYFLVVNGGAFTGIGKRSTDGTNAADETDDLTLVALATSSTLEATNTINETAARDGSGGSTNFIASGAMSWSTSVDGLLDVASSSGSAITVMDAARDKNYLIAKFNIEEGSGTDTFYAGQTLIDSVSITGGVDDIATYSVSLTGYGDLYKG